MFLKGFSVSEAILQFLLVGFVSGIVYDLFRFFRLVFANKVITFILDFLFFVLFSILFFILLLGYNNGSVRVLYFTSFILGFLVYVFTVFRITKSFQSKTAGFIRLVIKKSFKSFKKVLQFIKRVYYNTFVKHNPFTRKKLKAGSKNESASSEFKTE